MRAASVVVVSLLVLAAGVVPARAQSTRRPDLNMFGRGLRDPEQSLSLRASLGANFFDTITQPVLVPGRPLPVDHGWGSIGAVSIGYNVRAGAFTFEGSMGSFFTYYPQQLDAFRVTTVPGGGMHTGFSWPVSSRTTLTFFSGLRYRPLSTESTVPLSGQMTRSNDVMEDAALAFMPRELAYVEGRYLTAEAGTSLSHDLTRKLRFLGSYDAQRDFAFSAVDPQTGIWTQRMSAGMSVAVWRRLRVRGGYRYEESHYSNAPRPYHYRAFELGLDYGEGTGAELQLTRHTTLTLDGGLGVFADVRGAQHYQLTGRATLVHDMGRTWSSEAGFYRGLDSSELLFQAPVLTDTLFAQMHGIISRSLGFHASTTAERGAVGIVGVGHGTERITANTGLQRSLTRRLALSLDYTYFKYLFESDVARPTGVPAQSSSQGITVQLRTWMPLYQRRRSNATR